MKRLQAGLAVVLLLAAGLATPAAASDEEEIEQVVSAVLEAYRTGDYSGLSRYFASDVTVVPSDYSPTLQGWDQVEPRYQMARSGFGRLELQRENSRLVRRGKIAWVSYQWRLAGAHGDQMVQAQGHTTLILEKRSGHWLIVHNHTSAVPSAPPPAPAAAPQP